MGVPTDKPTLQSEKGEKQQQRMTKGGSRRRKEIGKNTYNVGEAKTHLSEILKHVEDTGEEVFLTNRGKPVARIVLDRGVAGIRQLGFARGEIKLLPGWDEPITFEEFFGE